MKHYNLLCMALLSIAINFFPICGMDTDWMTRSTIIDSSANSTDWMSQSTIFSSSESTDHPLSQSSFFTTELTKSQSSDKDQDFDNFKQTCSNFPYLFNRLTVATEPNDLKAIEHTIIEDLFSSVRFIAERDQTILDPESSERIKRLNDIKIAIEHKAPRTTQLIDQWKKTVENSCTLTINNIESFKSGNFNDLEQSSVFFEKLEKKTLSWPNTPQEQLDYLNEKNWDIPTKTYILQLLWWNMKQTLAAAPKNSYTARGILDQMNIFGRELRNINQHLPSIVHNKNKTPYPQFTFQLTKIPNDMASELKKLLLSSLTQEQKKMIIKRKEIEKKLSLDNQNLKIKEKLTVRDYTNHRDLLNEYYNILLPQDALLKEKIKAAIQLINEKIARGTDLLIEKRAKEIVEEIKIKEALEKQQQLDQKKKQLQLELQQKIDLTKQEESQKLEAAMKIQNDTLIATQEQLAKARLEEQQKATQQRLEQQRLAGQQRAETAKQWLPWINSKITVMQQSVTNFFTYLRSWWPF